MTVSESILELTNKIEALNDKINLVDGTVQFNLQLHWAIIIGVITIAGFALFFISKSIIQTGVEKGIQKLIDDNKLKLDKKNPEILGTIKLNNSEIDATNVRLVKLKDEPIINIETDKNNAVLKVNHREIIVEESHTITGTTMNGCFGEAKYQVIKYGKHKLIELILQNLIFSVGAKHDFMWLPADHWPSCNVTFCGSDEQGVVYNFSINPEGKVSIINPNNNAVNISAYVVFIACEASCA